MHIQPRNFSLCWEMLCLWCKGSFVSRRLSKLSILSNQKLSTLLKSKSDSQLTARTPAIFTKEFYFKCLFLELSWVFFSFLFYTSFYFPPYFYTGNNLFLWEALVSTADDNEGSEWHSLPSPAEASGWNEGSPGGGGIAHRPQPDQGSGCGHRAASADSVAEAHFKTTFAPCVGSGQVSCVSQPACPLITFSSSSHSLLALRELPAFQRTFQRLLPAGSTAGVCRGGARWHLRLLCWISPCPTGKASLKSLSKPGCYVSQKRVATISLLAWQAIHKPWSWYFTSDSFGCMAVVRGVQQRSSF